MALEFAFRFGVRVSGFGLVLGLGGYAGTRHLIEQAVELALREAMRRLQGRDALLLALELLLLLMMMTELLLLMLLLLQLLLQLL